MKKILSKLTVSALAIFFASSTQAQTAGTLTFSYTEVARTPTYSGNGNHCLAIWIQTNAGGFVKTKVRYLEGGGDHLPTWKANSASNVVSAVSGATKPAFAAGVITWDGTNAAGVQQADGIYKVTIEETWSHATTGKSVTSYTFTKGAAVDHQTPANNVSLSSVTLHWQPTTTTGIAEATASNPEVSVYPNPTEGIFNVDFKNANSIKVINTLGVVVYDAKVDLITEGSKNIDLTSFANGVYFINVSNGKGSINHKLILNK